MKVFYHFAAASFSNVYVVGPESPGEAVMVDPGIFNITLLKMIEDNGYRIASVLVTHDHSSHVHGLSTLLKVYPARVYACSPYIKEIPCTTVAGGDVLRLGELTVAVIASPGHSRDSLMFRIANSIFSGDALSAGRLGSAPNPYGHALLCTRLKEILRDVDPHDIIFPGHGPPSTVRAELEFNRELRSSIA